MTRSSIALLLSAIAAAQEVPTLTHGPFRGHVDATSLHVWARADRAGEFTLEIVDVVGDAAKTARATAAPEHDFVLHFVVDGFPPAARFGLRIRAGETVLHEAAGGSWSTALPDGAATATIAFGSCADDRGRPEQPIWERIVARTPDALVLLGDTPYIDDGTVGGRRCRYREFLGHPPIARALGAIPTWATWDDHDYATNDRFGAVPGTDTARPVFVDYHAHASYGDGERGIWTSFRRGPLEVFLLDTRSFADGESSVLAPGERSLLGARQIDWLQKGLAASTAPFKVLACGMVWNGGVRKDKADCWGNWLPERDALLRWIGANDVRGVVLVSGDVHRSRVIVHPVRELAGYDVPEFVTSPLAQGVIEANKVDVPGLVFDAGEPESCLFLTADKGPGGPSLAATFVAGDGREFWNRTFPASELRRGDAAAVYRRVETMLQAAFGAGYEGLPEQDFDAPAGVTAEMAVGKEWRAAVARAAPALAEWKTAAGFTRCRFASAGEPQGAPEFFDRIVGLGHLHRLGFVRGLQAIADRDEAVLREAVDGLLVLARHLFDEPTVVAWLFAHSPEDRAVDLAVAAAERWPEVGPALRSSLRTHLAARPSLGAIAVPVESECARLLDITLRALEADQGVRGRLARATGVEARRRCLGIVGGLIAPLARLGAAPDPAIRDEIVRGQEAIAARSREVFVRLKVGKVADGPRPGDTEDLADLLLALAMPNVVHFLDQHAAMLERLEAAVRER